ncbi:hypothetical protein A3A75_02210 [Candidatus Woesebacteria bacterium RIFCSPLOWO2_01_FULL_39_10]|uniref:Penicillin-binding protein 2 n=1 Tax=Candidatus Woesebacteria bacterium RIFCSPLOWO2_01_FULL_39_10 TaxID=1802516 RepID=A0A1F8B6S8_9BACT|nr:MAG: hypothetical protein A3A75_02210 [Candidatus Woesebacteria bacterium RIFCSPLOWO2_01_FULL_39_10]
MQTLSSTKTQSWLVWFLRGLLILGFLILIARLIDLQIIRGKYFRALSEENRIRRIPIVAARGAIYARGGEILVGNKIVKKKVVFDSISGFRKEEVEDTATEVDVITEWIRDYTTGSDLAHVSGYLGEVSQEELGKIGAECQEKGPKKLGALMGRGGLEEQYDCVLVGIDGEELVEVDAYGKQIRILGRKLPIPGQDIKTSIDYPLQRKVAELMKGKSGAVIVSDTQGEIIAFFSSPSYDPNIFVNKGKQDEITKLLNDQSLPIFNRVIGGMFHPGSVFKPVVAIAALEEGIIDEDYTYDDTGFINIETPYGDFSYKNWYFTQYGGTEGKIGLEKGIARSVDTFFYKIGELTGVDKLTLWAGRFGLDQKTGIDLPGEIAGLVPTPLWKIRVKGERWFLGNTYHLSIGQGDIALTPIAVNRAISAIANDGNLCPPHLANEDSVSGNYRCKKLDVNQENINLVKKGMVGACSSGGTGFTFFDFKEKAGVDVACKTGTAETDKGEPHAWFTVFAPVEEPQIVATVLVENGGEGSKVAGPIAREIFNFWFKVQPTLSPTPGLNFGQQTGINPQ